MSEQNISPQRKRRSPRFDPAVFLGSRRQGAHHFEASQERNCLLARRCFRYTVTFFYIKKGKKAKVTVVSKLGKEAVIGILGIDEFVGEGCLTGQPKRLATAVYVPDCVTMRVAKSGIQRLLRDEPAFSQMFVSHILARNARVEEDLLDQLFNSTEKRLARLLLLLANFGGRPTGAPCCKDQPGDAR